VSNVDFIQIMHQRTLVTQCQCGVHDHMSCQRTYLVVCESEIDFLTIFLDDSCVFRSNNKSYGFTLFLEWSQDICDRAEFPKQEVITCSKSIGLTELLLKLSLSSVIPFVNVMGGIIRILLLGQSFPQLIDSYMQTLHRLAVVTSKLFK
jgi:hypothetical protein